MILLAILLGSILSLCAGERSAHAQTAEGSQKGAFGIYRDTKVYDLKIKLYRTGEYFPLETPPSPHQYIEHYSVKADRSNFVCDITGVGYIDKDNAYIVGSTIKRQMEESYGKGRPVGEGGKVIFFSNDSLSGTVSSQVVYGRPSIVVSIQLKPRTGCADEPKLPSNSFN